MTIRYSRWEPVNLYCARSDLKHPSSNILSRATFPGAPSYGGVRTWVEGSHTLFNTDYYSKTNGSGSRQYILSWITPKWLWIFQPNKREIIWNSCANNRGCQFLLPAPLADHHRHVTTEMCVTFDKDYANVVKSKWPVISDISLYLLTVALAELYFANDYQSWSIMISTELKCNKILQWFAMIYHG